MKTLYIIICFLVFVTSACSKSKHSEASSRLKDFHSNLPKKYVTVISVEQPLDAIKSDFFTIIFDVDPSDVSIVESQLGFSISDGATSLRKSRISPDYPWLVNVTNKISGTKRRITISAKQPS